MDTSLIGLRERIVAAHEAKTPLRLRGGGSKDFYGQALIGEVLDTRAHAGIVDYEPSELVVTARCGTPLDEVERALAAHAQFLPFEPPSFGAAASVGGVVAAGLSGPRRAYAGSVRDFVLGAELLDARGELLRFGGQVMKNVAGFDVARLLCGSLGTLGLITQVSLKVLPLPRAETTLRFLCDARQALALFHRWRGQPLPVSATAWHAGSATVRLSGSPSALRAACETLGGEALTATQAAAWWHDLREHRHAFFQAGAARLWRLSLPATAPFDAAEDVLLEWGGALRWVRSDAPAHDMRARAVELGGTATLWHGAADTPRFHPLAPINLDLQRRLKAQFDPHGIFNRGRLYPEF